MTRVKLTSEAGSSAELKSRDSCENKGCAGYGVAIHREINSLDAGNSVSNVNGIPKKDRERWEGWLDTGKKRGKAEYGGTNAWKPQGAATLYETPD